jgi:hypothetical protein
MIAAVTIVGVGHVQRLGHDEGDSAHHRRHDLSAHRRGGFNGASKGGAEAETLHQRNGELARRHHIGHAGAGDRAHQRRRQDADLRGAAAPRADQPKRKIVEQGDHAGALKERREDHEDEDIGRRDIDWRAIDALGAEGEILDDLIEGIAAVREYAGHVIAEEAVGQKHAGDDGERPAHQPPGRLETQRDENRADHEIGMGEKAGPLDQVDVEDPVVEAG